MEISIPFSVEMKHSFSSGMYVVINQNETFNDDITKQQGEIIS